VVSTLLCERSQLKGYSRVKRGSFADTVFYRRGTWDSNDDDDDDDDDDNKYSDTVCMNSDE